MSRRESCREDPSRAWTCAKKDRPSLGYEPGRVYLYPSTWQGVDPTSRPHRVGSATLSLSLSLSLSVLCPLFFLLSFFQCHFLALGEQPLRDHEQKLACHSDVFSCFLEAIWPKRAARLQRGENGSPQLRERRKKKKLRHFRPPLPVPFPTSQVASCR